MIGGSCILFCTTSDALALLTRISPTVLVYVSAVPQNIKCEAVYGGRQNCFTPPLVLTYNTPFSSAEDPVILSPTLSIKPSKHQLSLLVLTGNLYTEQAGSSRVIGFLALMHTMQHWSLQGKLCNSTILFVCQLQYSSSTSKLAEGGGILNKCLLPQIGEALHQNGALDLLKGKSCFYILLHDGDRLISGATKLTALLELNINNKHTIG